MDRRTLLKTLGGGALGTVIYGGPNLFAQKAYATGSGSRSPFVLYLHMGPMEGWSAGLIQPHEVGKYPKGVFFPNEVQQHPNANVNVHHKVGHLIFNNYTKSLTDIADNMLFTVGNPQSLGHEEARRIQSTGSNLLGPGRTPGWAAGLAQAALGSKTTAYVVTDTTNAGLGVETARVTPGVSKVSAVNLAELKAKFSDSALMPATQNKEEYASLAKDIYQRNLSVSPIKSDTVRTAASGIDGLLKGIPGFDAERAKAEAAISLANVRKRIDDSGLPDKEAVKTSNAAGNPAGNAGGMPELQEKLRIAATLILTRAASGMSIQIPGHDYHSGGAAVQTARAGSLIWAYLGEFWKWVKAAGLQNDVLVIVANEFNRTAANNTSTSVTGVVGPTGTLPAIVSPGTDHHLSHGMVFINGNLPGASRLGGIGDTFVPAGSKGLDGAPDPSVPAFSSLSLVASVTMRAFPSMFATYRDMRDIWSPLKESDIIPALRG